MKIDSKFEYGDTVWWLHGNDIKSATVVGMKGEHNLETGHLEKRVLIKWGDDNTPFDYEIDESLAFKSKKGLVKKMLGDNWQTILTVKDDER